MAATSQPVPHAADVSVELREASALARRISRGLHDYCYLWGDLNDRLEKIQTEVRPDGVGGADLPVLLEPRVLTQFTSVLKNLPGDSPGLAAKDVREIADALDLAARHLDAAIALQDTDDEETANAATHRFTHDRDDESIEALISHIREAHRLALELGWTPREAHFLIWEGNDPFHAFETWDAPVRAAVEEIISVCGWGLGTAEFDRIPEQAENALSVLRLAQSMTASREFLAKPDAAVESGVDAGY